jgi:dihydrofolate reductase
MHVFIIAAETADGFIAKADNQNSMEWTSKADKDFFVQKTKEAGVVVMGRKTFDTIGKPLKGRHIIILTRGPVSQPPHTDSPESGTIEYSNESPADLLARLETAGTKTVAIAGGAAIYELFLQSGLVDTVYVTQEPVRFETGIRMCSDEMRQRFSLVSSTQLEGDTLLLEYTIQQ